MKRSQPGRSSTEPLRIVQVTAPAPIGGLESVVAELSGGLADRGHAVRLVAILADDDHCVPFRELPARGIDLVEIRTRPRRYRAQYRRLVETIAEFGPSIAHSHGYHADIVGVPAARKLGIRTLSTVHGFVAGGWKNRLYEWLDRRALRGCDAVIAVSRPQVPILIGAGIREPAVHLLPNAAPSFSFASREVARRALDLPLTGRIAGWVGRLSLEKGPDVFLRGLASAPADWHGSILGTGPMEHEIRRLAAELGLTDRVRWHGLVPDAGRYLPAFDAVVLSSRIEGTPMVLLEGLAARAPLVVTAVGGVPDVVDGDQALVIRPETPEDIGGALADIATSPASAQARSEAGWRRLARSFSRDAWLDRHEALYRNLPPSIG